MRIKLLVRLRIITGVKQGLDRTSSVIEDTDGEDNIPPNDDGNLMKGNIWYLSNAFVAVFQIRSVLS